MRFLLLTASIAIKICQSVQFVLFVSPIRVLQCCPLCCVFLIVVLRCVPSAGCWTGTGNVTDYTCRRVAGWVGRGGRGGGPAPPPSICPDGPNGTLALCITPAVNPQQLPFTPDANVTLGTVGADSLSLLRSGRNAGSDTSTLLLLLVVVLLLLLFGAPPISHFTTTHVPYVLPLALAFVCLLCDWDCRCLACGGVSGVANTTPSVSRNCH